MTINLLDKIKNLTSRVLQFLRIKTQKEIAETLKSDNLWKIVTVEMEGENVIWVICGKIGEFYIVWNYSNNKVGCKWITNIKNKESNQKINNDEENQDWSYKIWNKVQINVKNKSKIKITAYIIGYNKHKNKYIVWYVTEPTHSFTLKKRIENQQFKYEELSKEELTLA